MADPIKQAIRDLRERIRRERQAINVCRAEIDRRERHICMFEQRIDQLKQELNKASANG